MTSVQSGTKMKWLDSEIKRSKVKVTDNIFRNCSYPVEAYWSTVRRRRPSSFKEVN